MLVLSASVFAQPVVDEEDTVQIGQEMSELVFGHGVPIIAFIATGGRLLH